MLAVSERHVEALQGWEGLQVVTSRLDVGMTNRTDWAAFGCELLRVATRTRRVLHGTNGPRRTCFAAMAQQARKTLVTRIGVCKFGKIFAGFLS
jgi:hypothetical protein